MRNEMWPKRAQVEVTKVEQKLEKQQLCTAVHCSRSYCSFTVHGYCSQTEILHDRALFTEGRESDEKRANLWGPKAQSRACLGEYS